MATQSMTIDSQVHSYERNRSERPWASIPPWPEQVNGDDMVAAIEALGGDPAAADAALMEGVEGHGGV